MIIPNFTKLPYCKFKSNIYYLCNPVLQVVVLFFFMLYLMLFFGTVSNLTIFIFLADIAQVG